MSTFSVLKSNVSKELGLDETASGDEDVLLGRRLNQAVREFLIDTRIYVTTTTFTVGSENGTIDLQSGTHMGSDTNILAIDQFVDSNNVPFERVSVSEIDELRRASSTGSAGQRKYALAGANLLLIWPTPTPGDAYTIRYVPRPTEMSSAANDPSSVTYGGIPAEYHEALEFWAMWRMASYDDDTSSAQGDRYLGQYQLVVNRARKGAKMKGGRRQTPIRVGRRGLFVSSDPSRT